MRENRLSGSEGGEIIYRFSLPLFSLSSFTIHDSRFTIHASLLFGARNQQ